MKQHFVPWWEWEDYINGMWRKIPRDQEPVEIQKAIDFTGDWLRYGDAMWEVANAWPKTMLNSLTNTSINRRAFLGHCAVTFKIGVPEYITRLAWAELTNEQRFYADKQADKYIKEWQHHHARTDRTVHQKMGRQMLLWGDTRYCSKGDIRPRSVLPQDRNSDSSKRSYVTISRIRAAKIQSIF